MRPLRIAFSSMAVSSHLGPMLPLATAAAAAGHEVLVVSGPAVRDAVEAAGLPFDGSGLDNATTTRLVAAALAAAAPTDDPAAQLHALLTAGLIRACAPASARALRPVFDAWRPDLIVGNVGEYGSTLLSAELGVPFVVHGFGPPLVADDGPDIDAALADAAATAGTAPPPSYADHLLLDLWPRDLAPEPPLLHHDVLAIRPESVLPDPATAVTMERRHLYVTSGTSRRDRSGFLRLLLDGATAAIEADGLERDLDVVVTTGDGGDVVPPPGPVAVEVASYLPQQQVLPASVLVLSHGGAGTVLGALAHGVPVVVVPWVADGHVVGRLVARAGVGEDVPGVDPVVPEASERIAAAVHSVLAGASFTDRAREQADRIAAAPSPEVVVAEIGRRFGPLD